MRKWKLAVGILISLVSLILALRGIEWQQVGEALRRADWRYLIPAVVAILAYLLARSVRWRILLGPDVSLTDVFAVINIGYLISNVFPFRLGDPARAVAIGVGREVKISAALSTIVVERVLDMLVVVLLLSITLPFVGQAGWTIRAGMLGGAAAVVSLGVLIVLAWRPDWGRQIARLVLVRLLGFDPERWMETVDGLLEGVSALRSVRRAVGALAWSVVIWMLTVGYYFALLWAFLDQPTLVQSAFITCATGLGMALPSSPGAMGVFHSIARYALQLPFGVPVEEAVVVAFASHAFQYIVMCLLGLLGLIQQNLSLGGLQTDAETLARE
jgi:uncharacterized protein (TIRG00374 family)